MTEVTTLPVLEIGDTTDKGSSAGWLWRSEAPRFIGHPLSLRPRTDELLSSDATVYLWRFRTEWKRVSRIEGMASLSKAEAARVARFPKSPLSKRFAVERASLREILSGLTGRRAAEIELSEDFGGRVQLASRQGQWSIAIAHVALWTVIGVSRSRIGLASVSADYRSGDMQQETDAWRTVRAHVRQSSLRDAGIEADVKDVSGALLDNEDASYRFDAPSDHRWHLVDLPMAGSNLLTLTAPYPMEQVHGFGWTSSSGYLLTR